jgi:cation:H+ antiporter
LLPTFVDLLAFALSALVSLGASWILVSRIEGMGDRLGVTEAMLGLIAALAADAPEITSAVAALIGHQHDIGEGVIVGSNVFNLAALIGLGSVVAGGVALHRRVVVLTGAVSVWIAAWTLLAVLGLVPSAVALLLVVGMLVPYIDLAASRRERQDRNAAAGLARWLAQALTEEELELHPALEPRPRPPGGRPQAEIALLIGSLVVVVVASVVMERAASHVGAAHGVPPIVVGGIVLAAVTSLPNAVAAVYLARRGRGTAMLSTALNSNVLNVAVGFLLPAAVLGLGGATADARVVTAWYLGLTALTLVLAYRGRGVSRASGMAILAAYAIFVATILARPSG